MDIKLVKNFEEGMYIPVNREILLQIIDDNRRLEQFNGKHIFLFNPANNERFEILPEVPKFNVTKIYYGSEERDYFVFTSAKMINEHETQITFYWYQISLQETFIIHTQIVPTDRLREPDYLKVLVLAQDFCVFETKNGEYGNKDSYSFLLKDVKNNKELYRYEGENHITSYAEYENGYKVIGLSNSTDKYTVLDKDNKNLYSSKKVVLILDSELVLGDKPSYSAILYSSKDNKVINENTVSIIDDYKNMLYKYSDETNTYILDKDGKEIIKVNKNDYLKNIDNYFK